MSAPPVRGPMGHSITIGSEASRSNAGRTSDWAAAPGVERRLEISRRRSKGILLGIGRFLQANVGQASSGFQNRRSTGRVAMASSRAGQTVRSSRPRAVTEVSRPIAAACSASRKRLALVNILISGAPSKATAHAGGSVIRQILTKYEDVPRYRTARTYRELVGRMAIGAGWRTGQENCAQWHPRVDRCRGSEERLSA